MQALLRTFHTLNTDRALDHPADEKLDPRAAIAGRTVSPLTPSSEPWVGGLFDKGSWIETQSGWARSVVTGRARLGGIAVGVIAVETQTVMLNIPADPGAPDSSERVIPQVCPEICKALGQTRLILWEPLQWKRPSCLPSRLILKLPNRAYHPAGALLILQFSMILWPGLQEHARMHLLLQSGACERHCIFHATTSEIASSVRLQLKSEASDGCASFMMYSPEHEEG